MHIWPQRIWLFHVHCGGAHPLYFPHFALTMTVMMDHYLYQDDVIKWKHFSRYWPFVRWNHRSPVNSPHQGQWRGALMFSLICAWINSWVNNREASDFKCHRTHYDVIVCFHHFSMVCLVQVFQAAQLVQFLRPSENRRKPRVQPCAVAGRENGWFTPLRVIRWRYERIEGKISLNLSLFSDTKVSQLNAHSPKFLSGKTS